MSEQTVTVAIPTVHLNGTSARELTQQLEAAHTAIGQAIDALCQAAPHGRDYYVQAGDALGKAVAQHRSRLERLESVQHELEAIWQGVADQETR